MWSHFTLNPSHKKKPILVLKAFNAEPPQDAATTVLGIQPRETLEHVSEHSHSLRHPSQHPNVEEPSVHPQVNG